ncbi:MAG TPA: ABATE domain-containing protein [Candidatus Polarisedimenticolaceae bacterium]|nr:ABATE domain-containing protein [Candidatus Polarisedimenticolaceae bacterium]
MSHVSEATKTFDLSGGNLCLDFANTARHVDASREDLPTYPALVSFAEQTGTVTHAQARALLAAAAKKPAAAARVLSRAIELRGAIFRTFSAIAGGGDVRAEDLAVIDRLAADAAAHTHLAPCDGGFHWELDAGALRELPGPLWPVVRSATDLLTSGAVATVRECALETCSWLFLDHSKNQKRRWCDMKICGNRSKARRHYARTKGSA